MSIKFIDKGKRLPVAQHLTDDQYKQLMNTYAVHNRSMGLAYREKYSLANIQKVVVAPKGILKVYYEDNWWHYTPHHTWY